MSFLSKSCLVLLALVFLSLTEVALSVEDAYLNDVCGRTRHPGFCTGVLKANPKTRGADIAGLCQIAIDLTRASAVNTFNMLANLVKSASDPQLKERYSSCHDNYEEAVADIDEASQMLRQSDPDGVNIKASAAMSQADDCEEDFKSPPSDPSSLPTNNKILEDLASIVLAVSNDLPR